ncbi:MAG TPA: acyl carrier protein [Rhodospirillales bacterium]|nr:acyl carrier protein [Rhodospirillales bacterium]
MTHPSLHDLLRQQFPNADIDSNRPNLMVGDLAEWDSLAHFNFLMRIEDAYGVRFDMEEMSELKGLEGIAASLAAKGLKI